MTDRSDDTAAARLAGAVEQAWGGWTGPLVEDVVFGTRDPRVIADTLCRWAVEHLGAPVVEVLWYHASVGCSAAFVLGDGRRVVAKAYQPRFGVAYLHAMLEVQRHLHECWFPCPEPIGGVSPFTSGGAGAFVTAATLRPDVPGEEAPDLVSAAATLARLALYLDGAVYLGIDVGPLAPHPLQLVADGSLYPEPYSPAISFGNGPGTEWIDQLAARARAVMAGDGTPPIVTHIDWCPRNVRGDAAGVSAVFDLDSLAVLPEARAAGTAATAWSLAHPGADGCIELELLDRFVWVHQRVRDYWFDDAARRVVNATVAWNLAYTARCEMALGEPSIASASLRKHGELLLA